MKVDVKLIGYLSTTGLPGGFQGGVVYLSADTTVGNLLRKINIQPPVQFLIVRNQKLLSMDDLLSDGDVLQFIPPIGGGTQ